MMYFILAWLAIMARLAPHPANFTPIAALAMFVGATAWQQPTKAKRLAALLLPLLALLVSDWLIGFYSWQIMASVYTGFSISIVLGLILKQHYSYQNLIIASLAGSIIFFLLTNAAVWAFTPMYDKTLAGLMESYTLALPFFRNSLLGDLAYSAVLFGAYQLAGSTTIKLTNYRRKTWTLPQLTKI